MPLPSRGMDSGTHHLNDNVSACLRPCSDKKINFIPYSFGGGGGASTFKGSGLLSPQDNIPAPTISHPDINFLEKWFSNDWGGGGGGVGGGGEGGGGGGGGGVAPPLGKRQSVIK